MKLMLWKQNIDFYKLVFTFNTIFYYNILLWCSKNKHEENIFEGKKLISKTSKLTDDLKSSFALCVLTNLFMNLF